MFNRNIFKKKRRNRFPSGVCTINLLGDRGRHLREKIVIGHSPVSSFGDSEKQHWHYALNLLFKVSRKKMEKDAVK